LLCHLERQGCSLLREGANHSVYVNRAKRKSSTIPGHREINDFLARKICRDLDIPEP
jgi:mRNA interferase HicA